MEERERKRKTEEYRKKGIRETIIFNDFFPK